MITENIIHNLESLGLGKKEAVVYLSCLQHKKSTPRSIEKDTQISRPSTYKILDLLKNKGLVLQKIKNKKKYFVAIPIGQAFNNFYNKTKLDFLNFEKNLKKTEKKIKKFQELGTENTDNLSILEGVNSMEEILKDILTSNSDSFWIGSSQTLNTLHKKQNNFIRKNFSFKRFDNTSIDHGISFDKLPENVHFTSSKNKKEYQELKVGDINNNTVFAVSKEYFVITTIEDNEPKFFVIKNKQIVLQFKTIFKELWKK